MNPTTRTASSRRFFFPDWPARLQGDESLTPGLREGYRRTLAAFLQWCAGRGASPSVATAREYVELARLEQSPSAGRLQVVAGGVIGVKAVADRLYRRSGWGAVSSPRRFWGAGGSLERASATS